jgi:hypothetical protein
LPLPREAHVGEWSIIATTEYTRGTYGSSGNTDIVAVPFSLRYTGESWTVRLGSSWLSITGDGSVVPVLGSNARSVATGATASRTLITDSDFGDVIASAAYRFYRTREPNAAMDLTARVKFGTANVDKGLGSGSGRNDYAIQRSGYRDWSQ